MPQAAIRQYEEDEPSPEVVVEQEVTSQANEATVESTATVDEQSEPYYHYTVDTKDPDPWLIMHKSKIIAAVLIVAVAVAGTLYKKDIEQAKQTMDIVAQPEINDLYYVDFRVIKDNLRPAEKFRMAKVQDITGDVVTINFSSYFYFQEHELNEAIRYAQLRFEKFFQEKRHNYKISELSAMVEAGAIVLARRPEGNTLDGNVVVPDSHFETSAVFIPGKKENFTGLEYLNFANDGNKAELALAKFQESADLGFAKGQVNLAQMYLNGTAVEKDFSAALSLFKQGALQAYEPAILKYAIVCQQVASCEVADFYQELVQAGVNIEFTKQVDVRATTEAFEKAMEEVK